MNVGLVYNSRFHLSCPVRFCQARPAKELAWHFLACAVSLRLICFAHVLKNHSGVTFLELQQPAPLSTSTAWDLRSLNYLALILCVSQIIVKTSSIFVCEISVYISRTELNCITTKFLFYSILPANGHKFFNPTDTIYIIYFAARIHRLDIM